ncbi:MAG TPA: DUF2232 domain-containing protein [Thermoanaerobaculia bacterium]|nr:DUF2232 domain-containing protein [Thermoanaerobaculia bacterium]
MIESSLQQSESVSLPPIRPFGRVVRSVAGYGVATALMMVSPLLVFVPAALFHCALRNGRKAVWAAAAIAVGLVGLYFLQAAASSTGDASRNMAYASFAFLVLSIAIPSIAAVPLVERAEKFGHVLVFALAGSAIGLGVLELTMRLSASFSPYAVQLAKAQQNAASVVEMYRNANAGPEFVGTAQRLMQYGLAVLPAGILIDLCLIFVLSLMMFGRLKAWRGMAQTGTAAVEASRVYLFRNFALPEWLVFGFILGGLTPLTSGTFQRVAANVLAIVIFLYMLQGLAVIRFALVRAGAGVFGTVLAFSILAMLSVAGIGLLLIALVGLFDPFFDFRHLKRKDDLHEGHTD